MGYLMTEENYEKLKISLNVLETETLATIQERIQDARKDGDVSENSAFEEAMSELAMAQRKLEDYYNVLNNAEIIKVDKDSPLIQLDDYVEVKCVGEDWLRLKLVGESPISGNPENNELSIDSPLGQKIYLQESGRTSILVDKEVIEYEYRKVK